MDKKQIRKEIAVLINSIKEHSDNIGDKQHISQLELELILNKIEKLYQKSIVFNHINSWEYTAKKSAENRPGNNAASAAIRPENAEVNKETSSGQNLGSPADLFGSAVTPPVEKPKAVKKTDIKESQPAVNKIQKPPLSEIRSAIGLNDKFQFANELFDANIQEFEIAIQQLNSAGSLESAMEYFLSLRQLYNWKEENETSKRLLELVERRYS